MQRRPSRFWQPSALGCVAALGACAPTSTPPPTDAGPLVSPSAGAPVSATAATAPDDSTPATARPSEPMAAAPKPTHVLAPETPVALDGDNTLRIEAVTFESIAPSPDDPESDPSGSGVTVSVVMQRSSWEVRTELTELSAPHQSRSVGWLEHYRVTLLEVAQGSDGPSVALVVERVTTHPEGKPDRGRISKETSMTLADGTRLTFGGHSHKSVMAGQVSPLMIAVSWQTAGTEPVDDYVNLFPDESRDWTFRDHRVTVDNWDYGKWMDVTVQKLALQRVTAP